MVFIDLFSEVTSLSVVCGEVCAMVGGFFAANVVMSCEEHRELCISYVGPVIILFNLAHKL
jgi:hypothetical protein